VLALACGVLGVACATLAPACGVLAALPAGEPVGAVPAAQLLAPYTPVANATASASVWRPGLLRPFDMILR
jgi:hypothetical protein